MITNSVMKLSAIRRFPIMIVNNTHKTIRLKRDAVVAKVSEVESINSVTEALQTTSSLNNDLERDIHIPSEHCNIVRDLIRKNRNIFANKDSELSQTDTVTMKIPAGNHPLIK
jgi:hypothetical protein